MALAVKLIQVEFRGRGSVPEGAEGRAVIVVGSIHLRACETYSRACLLRQTGPR